MVRLAFMGSPDFAVATLEGLIDAGHEVTMVVSRPDRRRSRGPALQPTPVKKAALAAGLKVSLDPNDILNTQAEVGIVVAYGKMIRQPLLGAIPLVNLHLSLLPRWRGAAPLERAILAGDEVSGVCLMELEEGLDTGPVYARAEVEIGNKNLIQLRHELIAKGTALLVECLAEGLQGLGSAQPQEGQVTYATKVDLSELRLDWSKSAVHLERLVRIGRAWTTIGGKRLVVHRAHATSAPKGSDLESSGTDVVETDALSSGPLSPGLVLLQEAKSSSAGSSFAGAASLEDGVGVVTAQGILWLQEVQRQDGRRQSAKDWLRGVRHSGELILGS